MPAAARSTIFARQPPHTTPPAHDWPRIDEDPLPLVLRADDRIDPRPPRRGSGVLTGAIVALMVIAGGMILLDDRVRMPDAAPEKKTDKNGAVPPPLHETPSRQVADVAEPAGSVPREPAPPEARAASVEAQETAAGPAGPPERLPPPPIDTSDPWQVKALAVGLHPELSKAVLMRLSAEDYRNAGIAIRTALAETPNDGAHIHPTQRRADLALFRVHFVKGAPVDCRRYVVTVTMDRWATTALPMEKCGIAPPPRRAP